MEKYLVHHGIPGQKHGDRRFQNYDGTLTEEGRRRYGIGPARSSISKYVAVVRKHNAQKKAEKLAKKKQRQEELAAKKKQKQEELAAKKKAKQEKDIHPVYKMSDDELKQFIERKKLEKEALNLNREVRNLAPTKQDKTKALLNKVWKDVVVPTATEAGKKWLSNAIQGYMNAEKKKAEDANGTTEFKKMQQETRRLQELAKQTEAQQKIYNFEQQKLANERKEAERKKAEEAKNKK